MKQVAQREPMKRVAQRGSMKWIALKSLRAILHLRCHVDPPELPKASRQPDTETAVIANNLPPSEMNENKSDNSNAHWRGGWLITDRLINEIN